MSVNKLLTRAEHFLDSYLNKTQRIIFGVKYEEMCGDYPDQYRVHIEEKCSSTFHKIFIDEIKHTTDDDEYGTITVHAPFTEVFFYVKLIRAVVFWLCHIAKKMMVCTIVMTVFQMTLSEKHFLKKLKIKIYNSL